jgi:hypothetical protein
MNYQIGMLFVHYLVEREVVFCAWNNTRKISGRRKLCFLTGGAGTFSSTFSWADPIPVQLALYLCSCRRLAWVLISSPLESLSLERKELKQNLNKTHEKTLFQHHIMDLREKAAGMRARLLASMGRLSVVQGEIDGGQAKVEAGHQDLPQRGGQQDHQQWWPPLPPGTQAPPPPPVVLPPNVQPHGQARQAAAVRQQAPVIHRLATLVTGSTARQQAPAQMGNPTGVRHCFPPGMATAAATERPQKTIFVRSPTLPAAAAALRTPGIRR